MVKAKRRFRFLGDLFGKSTWLVFFFHKLLNQEIISHYKKKKKILAVHHFPLSEDNLFVFCVIDTFFAARFCTFWNDFNGFRPQLIFSIKSSLASNFSFFATLISFDSLLCPSKHFSGVVTPLVLFHSQIQSNHIQSECIWYACLTINWTGHWKTFERSLY